MATARRTSGWLYSYRSRTQNSKSPARADGLIHRLSWAGDRKHPAQPVNKPGEPIRWSARVKGADHRVNAPLTLHPEWVPEPWPACLRPHLGKGWLYLRTHGSGIPAGCKPLWARVRWSFPLRPRNDHRLPSANPPGCTGQQKGMRRPHARPRWQEASFKRSWSWI